MTSIAALQSNIKKRSSIADKLQIRSAASDSKEFAARVVGECWQDSSNVKECERCHNKFTVVNRKHHCRSCGHVYCGKCSSYKLVICGTLKRACFTCYDKTFNSQSNRVQGRQFPTTPSNPTIVGQHNSQQRLAVQLEQSPTPSIACENIVDIFKNGGVESLPAWVEFFAFVSNVGGGATVTFHPEINISDDLRRDIITGSAPRTSRQSTVQEEICYLFKARKPILNEADGEASTVFYNCYVSYRETAATRNADTKFSEARQYRQAVVLVSSWSFPQLAFQLLTKLDEAFFRQLALQPNSSTSQSDLVDQNPAQNMLQTAFTQVQAWPPPRLQSQLNLPFFGEMLQYCVPGEPSPISNRSTDFDVGRLVAPVNLMTMFAAHGLLMHLWTLWELLSTGQDVLVFAASPTQCTEAVMALASLLDPVGFLGDMRPYMTASDKDAKILRAAAMKKQADADSGTVSRDSTSLSSRKSSMLVGTNDVILLNSLDSFAAVVFMPPSTSVSGSNVAGSRSSWKRSGPARAVDSVREGMRKANAATFYVFGVGEGGSGEADGESRASLRSSVSMISRRTSLSKTGAGKMQVGKLVTFLDCFEEWREQGANKAMLACRRPPSAAMQHSILHRIKAMEEGERVLLGDKLIRDNLRELTLAFFKSAYEVSPEEVAAMREEALAREHQAVEEEKMAVQAELETKAGEILPSVDEVVNVYNNFPEWARENIPTLIMWGGYSLILFTYWLLGLPMVLLIAGAFVVQDKIPVLQAPKPFERALREVVPLHILYPNHFDDSGQRKGRVRKSSGAIDSGSGAPVAAGADGATDRADYSGVWKRVKTENFEALVAAQGAGFVQRKLAASAPLIHTITMDTALTSFRLQERGGPIDTDYVYAIDGEELQTSIAGKAFLDKVSWEGNLLKIQKIKIPDKDYQLTAHRHLEAGGTKIRLVAVFCSLTGPEKTVTAISHFEKMGPSPNSRPAPSRAPSAGPVGDSTADIPIGSESAVTPRRDLSGTWERTRAVNLESFLGAQGVGYMQRKLAATIALTHTISMDSSLRSVRIMEKGGPMFIDNTYTLGAGLLDTMIQARKFQQRAYWDEASGDLVVHRVADDKTNDMFFTRKLSEDGTQLVVTAKHRDLLTKRETDATSWFTKKGPSTLPPPIAADPESLSPSSIHPVPVLTQPGLHESKVGICESVALEAEEELDQDGKDGQDGQDGQDDEESDDGMVDGSDGQLSESMGRYADMSGVWVRDDGIGADSNKGVSVTHVLTMGTDVTGGVTLVRIQESNALRAESDTTYAIDGPTVDVQILGRSYRDRCFWEGGTLVVERVGRDGTEIVFKRDLEERGTLVRLVTIRRNPHTGQELESMALFSKEGPSPVPRPLVAPIALSSKVLNTDSEDAGDDADDCDDAFDAEPQSGNAALFDMNEYEEEAPDSTGTAEAAAGTAGVAAMGSSHNDMRESANMRDTLSDSPHPVAGSPDAFSNW